ncbi:MAG: sigma-54 dependent transcriptional regulator [Deltaproteobacteria bacterium]|nr:sigma-54 dependent transcriptional regulator [Deltaproteobacteria bacterium]
MTLDPPAGDTPPLLLVEDDAAYRRLYRDVLAGAGFEVIEADDRSSARAALETRSFPVVILDLMLPPDGTVEQGLRELEGILSRAPGTKVVVASGAGDVHNMLTAVRHGAYDFLTKPVDPDVLLVVVSRALARHALEMQVERLREELTRGRPEGAMIGHSPAFMAALRMAERIAPTDLPVLITGENGTGKELMARTLHDRSTRAGAELVAVNCGALPDTLLESTLFGHSRGAFTGAARARKGLFAQADGGTLFLDEVGDMPLALQVELLRALESGEILPVGEDSPVKVDVRVVTATNKDLEQLMAAGEFREDLYWRIRGAEVHLPSLRERPSDLPLLATHFLNLAGALSTDGRPRKLSPAAEAALLEHDWPGNLRELRFEMQRATVLCGDRASIEVEDLAFRAGGNGSPRPASSTLAEKVEALERREIEAALSRLHGNRTRAAEELGLSRQGLLKKMQRFGLS